MSELTLKDLIRLEEPNVENLKIRIARHKMKDRGWKGFDELIRFDDDLLTIFAANMGSDMYKDAQMVMTFIALPKSKALFRSAFINHGVIPHAKAKKHYLGYAKYQNYLNTLDSKHIKNKAVIKPPKLSKQIFYKLEQSPLLESYRDRLVIEWGKSQTYIQKIIDKPVAEIYPKGFVSLFPGWDKVHLSYRELCEIINNPDGNKDWHEYLTRHSGVYLIFDSSTGKQYVGSAYGTGGIWNRWEGYAKTGHNQTKLLKKLKKENKFFASNFTFSLHNVFPKTVTKTEVISYEQLLKNKLGSRAFGLNEN